MHLRASAGHSLDPVSDWSRIDGTFHRIPLSMPQKIAHIAKTGEPIRIDHLDRDDQWVRYPGWAQGERLRGFTGRPLVFRGETLGVLAAFLRVDLDDRCYEWLRTLSDAAAVAVKNARALEEAESLRRALELERDYLRDEVREGGAFGEILGGRPALNRVLRDVDTVAATDTSVLILGESGTGKELVARAIHQRSPRAGKPLVKVNCGAIPRDSSRASSSVTCAARSPAPSRDRIGRFQLADGGTLFLDEVGEIPLDLQAKLLRVLQEGEFERVGDESTRRVNVRVLAATNRDLQAGDCRRPVPSRLVLSARTCSRSRCRRCVHGARIFPISSVTSSGTPASGCMSRCRACRSGSSIAPSDYDWPGNIRELQNAVERAVILARGGVLELPLSSGVRPGLAPAPSQHEEHEIISERRWLDLERANIMRALRQSAFRLYGVGGAAELLGVNAGTLASRLKRLGIKVADLKKSRGGPSLR